MKKNIVTVKGLVEEFPMLGSPSAVYKLLLKYPKFPRYGGGGLGLRLSFDISEVGAWIEENLRGDRKKPQCMNILAGTRWDKSDVVTPLVAAKAVRGLEKRRAAAGVVVRKNRTTGKGACDEKAGR